jgi:heterodisulfide reductase subunit A2
MHEPGKATDKAKDLVRMAVAKASMLEPLKKSKLPVTQSALVIGGGVAGMTAALEIAEQGYDVYLIEREARLGGNLAKIHHVEDGKKLSDFADELIAKVRDKENIYVYLSTDIKEINGFVGNFKVTLPNEEIQTGAVIVATGAKQYTPSEHLYGQDGRVVTQLDLEEMMNAGPLDAKNVVFIQCVGSRNDEVPYCSRVCCTSAIRKAIAMKRQNPSAKVYILHKDIRTYGFREELYREASELGVNFIRFPEDASPEVIRRGNDVVVTVQDSMIKTSLELTPDLLVLSAGIRPNQDNEELAKMLKVPTSKDGFFLEAHMKLRPVDFATEGVFLAGLAHWPKFVDESIAQAAGAAARALTVISKGELETEGIIAAVNEDLCDGCGICESVCEYKAIEIVTVEGTFDQKRAMVNEGLCKGCGCCVAACPSGAMEQKGFKTDQMIAMIDAALQEVD